MNIPYTAIFVFIAAILSIAITMVALRRESSPIILLHLWWFGWLFVSLFSITGLYPPSNKTITLYITLLTSLTLGAALYAIIRHHCKVVPKAVFNNQGQNISFFLETAMLRLVLVTAGPFTVFFFIRSLFLMGAEESLSAYRAKVFGIGIGYPLLFKYPVVASINEFIIEPMNLAALFVGVAAYVQFRQKKILLTAFALIGLHSIMMMGRFGFHYIFMMLILIIVFSLNSKAQASAKVIKRAFIFFFMILIAASMVTLWRTPGKDKALAETIKMYAIDYHTVSFSIFNRELHDSNSVLHLMSYGRSSLGPFDRLLAKSLRLIGIDKTSQPELNGLALHINREVGQYPDGNKKLYNAFGSVLFSLYRDGGMPFAVCAGIIFGFFTAFFSESLRHRSTFAMSMLISLLFIGIYGIFQPVIEGPVYLAIIAIVATNRIAVHNRNNDEVRALNI